MQRPSAAVAHAAHAGRASAGCSLRTEDAAKWDGLAYYYVPAPANGFLGNQLTVTGVQKVFSTLTETTAMAPANVALLAVLFYFKGFLFTRLPGMDV